MAIGTTGAGLALPAATAATTSPGLFQVTASLLLVIGIIFALAFVLRRVQGLRAGGQGGVLLRGGLQVGGRERVLLIEVQGRSLLIGVAPGSVRALHVFDPGETPPQPEIVNVNPAAFAERLRSLLRGNTGAG
jgi:flagellar protein FliO/FliZ